jgi:hypothetical protein
MKHQNDYVNPWLLVFYVLLVYLFYYQGHEFGHSIIAIAFGSFSCISMSSNLSDIFRWMVSLVGGFDIIRRLSIKFPCCRSRKHYAV